MIGRRTIAVSFAFLWLLTAGRAPAAQAGSSTAPASTSASSHPKTTAHKHKHSAKHEPPGQKVPTPERVSEIQSALAREGYYQGDPTGKLDSGTQAALEKFQSAKGLDSTGKLDAPTLQKLGLGSDIAGVSAPKPVVPGCCATKSAGPAPTSSSTVSCCSATSTANPQTQPPAGPPSSAAPGVVSSDPKPEQK